MIKIPIKLFFVSVFVAVGGVMEKGRIPLVLTGTAVGLISVIGFTPDIFAGPMIGYFLDKSPGELGHQHVFWLLALFSFVGGFASLVYLRMYDRK